MALILLLLDPRVLILAFWLALLAGWRSGAHRRRRVRMVGLILVGLAVTAWFGSAVIGTGYAVFLVAAVFGVVTLPLVTVGAGLILGSVLTWVEQSSGRRVAAVLAVAVGALPVVALDVWTQSELDGRREASERREEFATLTFEAAFGSGRVRLPAAPTIEVHYRTPEWSGVTARFRSEQHDFTRDPATGEPIPIAIRRITVSSVHPECDGVEREDTCNKFISARRLAAWCESRGDVGETPWCERPRHDVEFQLADELERWASRASIDDYWPLAELPPLGSDANGHPIRLRCYRRSGEDQSVPGSCRAILALRHDVGAEIRLHGVTPDTVFEEGREMVAYARTLWHEMAVTGPGESGLASPASGE